MKRPIHVLSMCMLFFCVWTAAGLAAETDLGQTVLAKAGVERFEVQSLTPIAQPLGLTLVVTLDGRERELVMVPHSVRSPRFALLVDRGDGVVDRVAVPVAQTFRGYVRGVAGSEIAASVREGRVQARVQLGDHPEGLWIIEPATKFDAMRARNEHVIYRKSDVIPMGGTCATEVQDELLNQAASGIVRERGGGLAGYVCEIACDADVEYFTANNESVDDTVADIESVINAMSLIYELDVRVSFTISSIIVRTVEPDPYGTTNPYALLDQVMDHWNANHQDIQRDVVMLFTGRDLAGTPIGIAYQDSICRYTSYAVIQARFTTDFDQRTALAAHEIGHTFNAAHCDFADPWCRIMCPNITECSAGYHSFGPFNADRIKETTGEENCFDRTVIETVRTALPFVDLFNDYGDLDPALWTAVDDASVVGGSIHGRMEIDVGGGWDIVQDLGTVRTRPMRMPNQGTLAFKVKPNYVDAGDSLKVEYFDSANYDWILLDSIVSPGGAPDYESKSYVIPPDGVGEYFSIRLSGWGNASGSGDEWMVDDFRIVPATAPQDVDWDGDVDADDFVAFVDCLGGPSVTSPPVDCDPEGFIAVDSDGDGDVDGWDVGAFQRAFTGEPVCGNGYTEGLEFCDDAVESAACDADCTFAECGDGVVNSLAGEECDPRWESADCDGDCTFAVCGDGWLNPLADEECDDGGESYDCDADCTPAECGDGTVNQTRGEECDTEGQSAECDWDCTFAICGDGWVNGAAGEQCEPPDGVHCDESCQWVCGDGVVQQGEQCDPPDGVTCDEDCQRIPSCGDGYVDEGEECDDGGMSEMCDGDCTFVECGDNYLNWVAGEGCDDGNTVDGDGCSSICSLEAPLPTCVVDFESGCPEDDVICGMVIHGVGYCGGSGIPNCIDTWPVSFKIPYSGSGDIYFMGDVHDISLYFTYSGEAWGEIEFRAADGSFVDFIMANEDCEYGEPHIMTLQFAQPVRSAHYDVSAYGGGAVYLDTVTINP